MEYVGGKNFIIKDRPTTVLHYIFLIEASYKSVRTGVLANVAQSIKKTLLELPGQSKIKVSIVTFNSTIQFYNLNVIYYLIIFLFYFYFIFYFYFFYFCFNFYLFLFFYFKFIFYFILFFLSFCFLIFKFRVDIFCL